MSPELADEARAILARADKHADECFAIYCGWECEFVAIADDAIDLLKRMTDAVRS